MTSKRGWSIKNYDPEKMARAYGVSLPISTKHSTELARFLKGKPVLKALKMLDEIMELKLPVPYRRYKKDLAHKPGIGPGRYPVKAAKYFKKVLENAINNAKQKGLDVNKMVIIHIAPHKAVSDRKRSRYVGMRKRTHLEVVIGVGE